MYDHFAIIFFFTQWELDYIAKTTQKCLIYFTPDQNVNICHILLFLMSKPTFTDPISNLVWNHSACHWLAQFSSQHANICCRYHYYHVGNGANGLTCMVASQYKPDLDLAGYFISSTRVV